MRPQPGSIHDQARRTSGLHMVRERTRPGAGAGDRLPQHHRDSPMRAVGEGHLPDPCPHCGTPGMQAMHFELKNGDAAQMRRCNRCEWSAWWCNGHQVSLAELLAAVQGAGLPYAPRRRSTG